MYGLCKTVLYCICLLVNFGAEGMAMESMECPDGWETIELIVQIPSNISGDMVASRINKSIANHNLSVEYILGSASVCSCNENDSFWLVKIFCQPESSSFGAMYTLKRSASGDVRYR
jgi:hypothetical protein